MPRVTSLQRRPRPARQAAFTLIELLTVMVIIIILLSITISVQHGITNSQNVAKAKGEIQALGTGLEQFKLAYGDYPPASDSSGDTPEDILAKALTGRGRWEHQSSGAKGGGSVATFPGSKSIAMPTGDVSSSTVIPYKSFVDLSKFSLGTDGSHPNPVFVDPWGNPYLYRYKTMPQAVGTGTVVWKAIGYLLVSRGPDSLPNGNSISQIFPNGMDTIGVIPTDYFDPGVNPGNADNVANWNIQ
jgi:type II secretory pathway pseudopilin PulG